ncbi:hypothetical protein [Mesorhizobium sp. CA6]|nr:hypothetical protein [Mesorhizobium sp. CA6]
MAAFRLSAIGLFASAFAFAAVAAGNAETNGGDRRSASASKLI